MGNHKKPRNPVKRTSQAKAPAAEVPIGIDKEVNKTTLDRPKSWWERQTEPKVSHLNVTIIVTVVVAVLGGISVIFFDRWTDEMGEHQKTTGRAERAEGRERDLTTERDKLKKEVADLRTENAAMKKLHPILEFYGPRAKYTASHDLAKDAGSQLAIGKCPAIPCIIFTLLQVSKEQDGTDVAEFGVGGWWKGYLSNFPSNILSMPIKRWCRATFSADVYHFNVVIEEDRVHDMRLGVGISVGDMQPGFSLRGIECPEP